MATAKTAKASTAATWSERCVQLAEARNLVGAARWMGFGISDPRFERWLVPSRTGRDEHVVLTHPEHERPSCDCIAASHGLPCSHVGAVLGALKQRERAHDDPMRTFATTGEW